MNAFEYTVTPGSVAKDGMATVSAISGFILNAAYRTLSDEGYGMCVLSRCSFEIDERPKCGELVIIRVNSGLNNIVTILNRNVVLTDNEGHEIGRGKIEWILPKVSEIGEVKENPSRIVKRYINRFKELIPETDSIADLQIRIDIDFKDKANTESDFSVAFKKICDSRYFFLARSGRDTLCRAMLQTA